MLPKPSVVQPESMFEQLEARKLLSHGSGELPHAVYYPEGYTHGGISEFVPITNPNDRAVEFELHARYEGGQRDQLIASGTIPAKTRGGVTITRANQPGALVRKHTPYALVLMSSEPVSATISHYDFDTAIGESFTDRTDTEWAFGDVRKDRSAVRDFIVFFNPNDHAVEVTLTAYDRDGRTFTVTRTVEAHRRGGFNINREAAIPEGEYGVRLHASAPVVAALSHYEFTTGRGFGSLGKPGAGATAGVITAIDFDDHSRGRGGDDDDSGRRGGDDDDDDDNSGRGGDDDDDNSGRGGGDDDDDSSGRRGGDDDDRGGGSGDDDGTPDQGPGDAPGTGGSGDDDGTPDRGPGDDGGNPLANAYLSILNANDAPATVDLTFLDHDDDDDRFVGRPRVVTVAPRSRVTLSVRELDFPLDDDEFGVVYRSDVPVTMTGSVYADRDATGVEATSVAATRWDFAEGFLDRRRAGLGLREELYLFNPTGREVTVTIEFLTGRGRVVRIVEDLDPLEIDDVHVHAVQSLLNQTGSTLYYGIRVQASGTIVAGMEHWDGLLGGGFAYAGMPGGTVAPLADVLII